MAGIQPDMPDLSIMSVEDYDVVLPLDHLHALLDGKEKRRRIGPALVAGIGHIVTAFRIFAVFLHHGGGFGLEDRIGVVADQRYGIAIGGGPAGIRAEPPQIDDWTWARIRRLEVEHIAAPRAGK